MKYQVPRSLGLNQVKLKKNGNFWCEFGFANGMQHHAELDSEALRILEFCFQPRSVFEIAKKTSQPLKKTNKLIKALCLTPFLGEVPKKPKSFKRYDRHLLFFSNNEMNPIKTQTTLSKSVVTLIGVGGIGNWVAMNMIGSGYKEIRLVDFDTVELSNLTRQVLFQENSVGKSKVVEASRMLRSRNKQTKIKPFDKIISSSADVEKIISGSSFVVLSADRPKEIHDWVDSACVKMGIPYINLGYRDGVGVVGPLTVPQKTSCYQCFKQKRIGSNLRKKIKDESKIKKYLESWDKRYQAPSFGPLNALVSTIGSLEVLKYLTAPEKCITLDRELSINPMNLQTDYINYRPDKKCRHCRNKQYFVRG